MIITRNIINPDIDFYDYGIDLIPKIYSYNDLSKRIDFFKNFLMDLNCKKGESVLIGYHPCLDQIALFFAVCELGLNFIVNDYKILDGDLEFIDTKTKILLPFDYFFDYSNMNEFKRIYLANISRRYISYKEIESYDNYDENNFIFSGDKDILMKCTSSGTTGTPKKVEHTHEFLYNISNRNSKFFDETVGLSYNFNHGSSLATYFIPSLMSKKVKKFINFPDHLLRNNLSKTYYDKSIENILNTIDHIMIPYSDQLIDMLELYETEGLRYYTLSGISEKMYKLRNRCKDIVSIFGCNETSGPVFINKVSYESFKPDVYYKIDDYYDIETFDPLVINLKEYNTSINTKDIFEKDVNSGFKFRGRKDLLKINGKPITKEYDKLTNSVYIYDFVYDFIYNEIYLCIWDKIEDKFLLDLIFKNFNMKLGKLSDGAHKISKIATLEKSKFISGVKLDQELLRCYFREKVKEYDQV